MVQAHIPEAEIQTLIVELRSATAGVGTARAEATTATTYVAQPDAGVVVVTIEATTDAISIPAIAEDVVVTLDDRPVEPEIRRSGANPCARLEQFQPHRDCGSGSSRHARC